MSGECLSLLQLMQDMQSVIEVRITNLNGLRKLASSELTQYEIRNVEGRLIHLFGRQLASKHGMDTGSGCSELNRYPNFKQWLHVVDVHPPAAELLMEKVQNLSHLIKLGESEIRTIMKICGCEEKEITRLLDAVKSLKKAFNANYPSKDRSLEDGAKSPDAVSIGNSIETVIDPSRSRSNSPSVSSSPEQKRPSIDSLSSDLSEVPSVPITPPPFNNKIFKLPPMPTPPHTPTFNNRVKGKTPPPTRKTNLPLPAPSPWVSVDHLNKKSGPGYDSATLGRIQGRRDPRDRRFSDDHSAMRQSSPCRSEERLPDIGLPPKQATGKLCPPKSPRSTHRSNMIHAIKHRFSKKTSMKPQSCDYCHEKIVVLQRYKCKDCKYICHSNCKFHAEKVPSCGLPRKYEEIFRETINSGRTASPIMSHKPARTDPPTAVNVASSTGDSSSNPSSTTSSTPSSPAPFISTSGIPLPSPSPALPSPSPRMMVPQFKFPPDSDDFLDNNENVTSTSSDRTITVDSHDTIDPFTDSERTLPEQVEPVDEVSDPEPNLLLATRKNSQKLLSEWDIPFEQLEILDLIGTGRFGAVHKGKWHGDVAIKMMDIDTDDEKQLQAFKREVSYFRKTRHDFVVLFMGACMRPPHLAIVTSLCKGQTLYTHIHLRKDRFNINRTIQIATQITQGMSYLHHKGIVHKDLKSKNIFIENGKVVLTDFALFSIGRLSKQKTRKDSLVIPDGWLCYLAPELITSLKINTDGTTDMELPFSEKSDVYSFGTIWYELLAGEWPFHKQPVETVIWQVGKGLKQPLNHLQASRDVKEILMMCWSYSPDSRPIFQHIKKTILRLPKKKGLHRSPSHPLHLSRSAESVL